MKNILLFFFLNLLTFVSFAQQNQGNLSDTQKTPRKLLKQIKKENAYLIDVRTPEEYNAGHLKYSKNIDFKSTDFKAQINKLNKKKPVYLYCRTGNRSGKALDTLKTLGFVAPYNIGGFATLTVAGLPAAY